jgi:hypothetical protein
MDGISNRKSSILSMPLWCVIMVYSSYQSIAGIGSNFAFGLSSKLYIFFLDVSWKWKQIRSKYWFCEQRNDGSICYQHTCIQNTYLTTSSHVKGQQTTAIK